MIRQFKDILLDTEYRARFICLKTQKVFVKVSENEAMLDYSKYQDRDDSLVVFGPDHPVVVNEVLIARE